jgi:nitrogen fixation/metabolism regulation signal transduction histidine kinase
MKILVLVLLIIYLFSVQGVEYSTQDYFDHLMNQKSIILLKLKSKKKWIKESKVKIEEIKQKKKLIECDLTQGRYVCENIRSIYQELTKDSCKDNQIHSDMYYNPYYVPKPKPKPSPIPQNPIPSWKPVPKESPVVNVPKESVVIQYFTKF